MSKLHAWHDSDISKEAPSGADRRPLQEETSKRASPFPSHSQTFFHQSSKLIHPVRYGFSDSYTDLPISVYSHLSTRVIEATPSETSMSGQLEGGPLVRPDPIPTLLLAMERIWYSSPQKSLQHLLNLIKSTTYRFLDALATLCTFAPLCDAAAVVVGSEQGCAHLYISAQPAISPELQTLIRELLPHVQSLPGTPLTMLDVSKGGFNVGMLQTLKPLTTTPDHQIIIAVFRACHAKFRESVAGEGGCRALLSALRKQAKNQPKSRGELETLSAKLDYLLKATSRDAKKLSDVDVLSVYYTADDVLRSMERMKTVLPPIGKAVQFD